MSTEKIKEVAEKILAEQGVQCTIDELRELLPDDNAVLKLKFCLEAIEYALSLSSPVEKQEWISVDDRNSPIPNDEDVLILFDTGEVRLFSEDWPFSIVTHWCKTTLPNKDIQ